MFGKKYSADSVRRASEHIKYYDENKYDIFDAFPPKLVDEFNKDMSGKTILNKEFRQDKDNNFQFGMGVCIKILEYFYEGDVKHSENFYKDSIYKAFNQGFMMNFGKTMYKGFCKARKKPSKFFFAGENWSDKYYIPKIIEEGINIEQYLKFQEYEECMSDSLYFREKSQFKDLEELAVDAGVDLKTHKKFFKDELYKFEELYRNYSVSDFKKFLKKLDGREIPSDGNIKIHWWYDVYTGVCKYLKRQPIPELLEDFNNFLMKTDTDFEESHQDEIFDTIQKYEEDGLDRIEIIKRIKNKYKLEVKRLNNKWKILDQ